jgi:hypothetical protein
MLKCDDQKLLLLLDFIQIVAYSSLEWTIPRGRFIEHLSRTTKCDQKHSNYCYTPKAAAKRELLFNKRTSES